MKIALWNADSFVGSNFASYFLQNTKHDLCLFVSPLSAKEGLAHLAAPLSSRSRVSIQVSGSEEADLARLQLEKPDVIVCTEEFPEFLVGKYKTIYIGRKPDIYGPSRVFLYSNAFGPRQPKNQGIASAIMGNELNSSITSAVYIKDLFDQFLSFLEKEDKFSVASETNISSQDIKNAVAGESSSRIQNAIAHTYAWYCGNPWYQLNDR